MYRDVYMLSLHSLYKYMKQIKSVTVQKNDIWKSYNAVNHDEYE